MGRPPIARAWAHAARGAVVPACVCGAFFAACLIVGRSFAETGGFSLLVDGWGGLALSLARLALLACVLAVALAALFGWLDLRAVAAARPHRAPVGNGCASVAEGARRAPVRAFARAAAFADRHAFGCSMAVLAVAWGAYLIVFAPGSLTYDGARSLNQFTTDTRLENHHPVLMNLLYGALMHFGRALGSDDAGLFLIAGLQAACLALALSGAIAASRRLGLPGPLALACLLYFALFPAWGVLAQDVIKDTLFCAVFAWFCLLLCAAALRPDQVGGHGWLVLGFAALLVSLTRNNGIYLVVPSFLALAVLASIRARQNRKAAAAPNGEKACPGQAPSPHRGAGGAVRHSASPRRAFPAPLHRSSTGRFGRRPWAFPAGAACAVVVLYVFMTSVAYPAMGVDMREEKEMLSVPFQQTARTFAAYPEDVSVEEFAAVNAVLPAESLAALYNPDLADPVKESYKLHNSKIEGSFAYADEHPDALGAYLRVWASMGLRHPGTYVSATVANTYAYFYPGTVIDVDGTRPVLLLGQIGEPINLTYDAHYLMPEGVVKAASDAVQGTLSWPGARFLYGAGAYVWALVAAAAYLVHARRWEGLVVCVPAAMLVLTVLGGPLNGHLRYVMPMIAVLPLLWSFAFCAPATSSRDAVARAARGAKATMGRAEAAKEKVAIANAGAHSTPASAAAAKDVSTKEREGRHGER